MPTAQAQWLTLAFMLAVTMIIIAYDVVIIQTHGTHASISFVSRRMFGRFPALAIAVVFWLGVLVGHIWLPAE